MKQVKYFTYCFILCACTPTRVIHPSKILCIIRNPNQGHEVFRRTEIVKSKESRNQNEKSINILYTWHLNISTNKWKFFILVATCLPYAQLEKSRGHPI